MFLLLFFCLVAPSSYVAWASPLPMNAGKHFKQFSIEYPQQISSHHPIEYDSGNSLPDFPFSSFVAADTHPITPQYDQGNSQYPLSYDLDQPRSSQLHSQGHLYSVTNPGLDIHQSTNPLYYPNYYDRDTVPPSLTVDTGINYQVDPEHHSDYNTSNSGQWVDWNQVQRTDHQQDPLFDRALQHYQSQMADNARHHLDLSLLSYVPMAPVPSMPQVNYYHEMPGEVGVRDRYRDPWRDLWNDIDQSDATKLIWAGVGRRLKSQLSAVLKAWIRRPGHTTVLEAAGKSMTGALATKIASKNDFLIESAIAEIESKWKGKISWIYSSPETQHEILFYDGEPVIWSQLDPPIRERALDILLDLSPLDHRTIERRAEVRMTADALTRLLSSHKENERAVVDYFDLGESKEKPWKELLSVKERAIVAKVSATAAKRKKADFSYKMLNKATAAQARAIYDSRDDMFKVREIIESIQPGSIRR